MSKSPAKKTPAKRRKPTRPTPKPKVAKPPKGGLKIDPSKVELVQRPGPKDKGDGAGGEYWDVMVDGVRAGGLRGERGDPSRLPGHQHGNDHEAVPDRGAVGKDQ